MATYNGSRFVAEQARSILEQLGPLDELVVVDDASTDDTLAVIASIGDPRVHVHPQPSNRGYVRAFERALSLAAGDVMLLSDQDDVWTPGRLETMVAALNGSSVVAGNYSVLGAVDTRQHVLDARFDRTPWRNQIGILVGYRPYFGCGMGLRRDALPAILPIPRYFVESHDLWLALVGNSLRSIAHLAEPVVSRRLHDANVTPLKWRSLASIAQARFMLLRGLIEARHRARNRGPVG
ncbi:MAG: glycosyl transferase [Microbacteriaceae bacterium]|nr:glycosyl transferase [Microbacteriaceae bacterium]